MVHCRGLRGAKGSQAKAKGGGILVRSIQVMCRCVGIRGWRCDGTYEVDWIIVSWEYTRLLDAGECGNECEAPNREWVPPIPFPHRILMV